MRIAATSVQSTAKGLLLKASEGVFYAGYLLRGPTFF